MDFRQIACRFAAGISKDDRFHPIGAGSSPFAIAADSARRICGDRD
jgi:hypothetical protein